MKNFIMSDMGTVRARIKKPAITAVIVMVLLFIQETFIRHTIGYFLTKELLSSIGACYMIGGLWYGKNLAYQMAQRPVDDEGEYYPEHVSTGAFRVGLAVAVGATVGAVCFGIDTLRIIAEKILIVIAKKV
ncbi:MAG: hypothetical protein HDR25_08350 [Lachnospiraceae bacterium]|nr:hypothetical protein [Lachnospiraceae bacterium]